MIRTIIVDDEILSRIGIRSFIDGKEEIQVTGIFGDAKEALEFLRSNVTDIVITDIEMSDMSGLDLISAIRGENLAPGIIILSCHDNFSYAQTAISKGTNSYLLKMDITEETLVQEVLKVYRDTAEEQKKVKKKAAYSQEPLEEGTYAIGIPRIKAETNEDEMEHLDSYLLVSLLEEVVSRYHMGTLFSPYNREMFIIFRFDRKIMEKDLYKELEKDISAISGNVQQYINGKIIFGISSPFTDLKDTRARYDEAVRAADLDFYDLDREIYKCEGDADRIPPFTFSSDTFMEADGMTVFTEQLHNICETARRGRFPVEPFKHRMSQDVSNLIYQIIHENRISREFADRWTAETASVAEKAKSISKLEESIERLLDKFHRDILAELKEDDLAEVFRYIEQNLDKKISLTELAEAACMSIPSMSKKFKERTGITITQYINTQRIGRVKFLLKNPANSLWQIAEITGFANVNYLIRVFKKITGMTIGEYRRSLGISTWDEEKDTGE